MLIARKNVLPVVVLGVGAWLLAMRVATAHEGAGAQHAEAKAKGPHVLAAVPAGYYLHAYDDCGVPERQPHVAMRDCYCWTFQTSDTDADLKSRSAVFSYKSVNLNYAGLDPKLSYVLALTYASDHVYHRVQSLWANGVQLHEPMPLPHAKAVRVVVKVPPEVKRLGEVAVGDTINVVLEQGLLLEFQPAGSETVEPQAVVAGATAAASERPGAAVAGGVMATVTVTKIDQKARLVSLQGPKGKVYQVKAGPKVQLDRLKVGDRLLATYVESVAIQLEKAGTKL